MPLPAYEIRNSLIDFSGFNQGINALGQARQRWRQEDIDSQIGARLAAHDNQGAADLANQLGSLDTGGRIQNALSSRQDALAAQNRADANQAYDRSWQQKKFDADQANQNRQFGLQERKFAADNQGNKQDDYGVTPQYGVDADGNPVLIQLSKHGNPLKVQLPDGVKLSRAPIKMDAGTHFVLLDPITRAVIGDIPKDVAGEASAKVQGEMQGKAAADLPQALNASNLALETIDKIRSHPGKAYGVGAYGVLPGVPGTAQRGFVDLVKQAQGQVFVQAYQALKGAGAISDSESPKAEASLSRLDRAQTSEDFDAALNDLELVIHRAQSVLQKRANPKISTPGPSQSYQGYLIEKVE